MFLINSKQNYIIGKSEINMQPKISKEQVTCIYIHMYIFFIFLNVQHIQVPVSISMCVQICGL